MTIETKFNINDKIFFLSNNKSCTSTVRGMKIHVSYCPEEIDTDVVYLCNDEANSSVFLKVDEKDAFPSKEELLKSL